MYHHRYVCEMSVIQIMGYLKLQSQMQPYLL